MAEDDNKIDTSPGDIYVRITFVRDSYFNPGGDMMYDEDGKLVNFDGKGMPVPTEGQILQLSEIIEDRNSDGEHTDSQVNSLGEGLFRVTETLQIFAKYISRIEDEVFERDSPVVTIYVAVEPLEGENPETPSDETDSIEDE